MIEVWFNREVLDDVHASCDVFECSKFEIDHEKKLVLIYSQKGFAPWEYDINDIDRIYHLLDGKRYFYYEREGCNPHVCL